MAEMLINNWGGGIGDDPFLARDGECLDMDGIDIRTTPRKIQADSMFGDRNGTTSYTGADTLYDVKETIDGLVQCFGSATYIGTTSLTSLGLVSGADKVVTVGSNLSDYNATTNPDGLRHFFFTYDNVTNPIKIVTYSGGVRANRTAVNTGGGASPARIPLSYRTTAVCYLWEGAILFARGNNIYEFNPNTEILSTGMTTTGHLEAKIALPYGASVKYMYYNNGQIQIVYTIGNNTYIQGCSYDGVTYTLSPYIDTSTGYACIDAIGDGGKIYWISTTGIHIWNGVSQLVKYYTFNTSSKVSFNKGIFKIIDDNGAYYYEYGTTKPGFGSPLTKTSLGLSPKGISPNYIITYQSGLNVWRYDTKSSWYKASNYWISHPYTAGQFSWKKTGLGMKLGFKFPGDAYVDSSTQASIVISVQTDLIERASSSTYVTVCTITDHTLNQRDIMLSEITQALQTAGYSEKFGYIRFKITLNCGDQYATPPYDATNLRYRKTPEILDLYIGHAEVQNPFK